MSVTAATLDEFRLHVEERHYRRVKDGDASPDFDCPACCAAFPRQFEEYAAERGAARASWLRRSYHDPVAHDRGHPERPLIATTERMA